MLGERSDAAGVDTILGLLDTSQASMLSGRQWLSGAQNRPYKLLNTVSKGDALLLGQLALCTPI